MTSPEITPLVILLIVATLIVGVVIGLLVCWWTTPSGDDHPAMVELSRLRDELGAQANRGQRKPEDNPAIRALDAIRDSLKSTKCLGGKP